MTKHKCLKSHGEYHEQLCMVGRNNGIFDKGYVEIYCPFCNKVRRKSWFQISLLRPLVFEIKWLFYKIFRKNYILF
jgi:hypothetical protein